MNQRIMESILSLTGAGVEGYQRITTEVAVRGEAPALHTKMGGGSVVAQPRSGPFWPAESLLTRRLFSVNALITLSNLI